MITPILEKIYKIDTLLYKIEIFRAEGKKIAFTNGCFDILHHGHVIYLEKAKKQADILIVALNSDDSIRRLGKSTNRPINLEQDRAVVVAALASVDGVIIFHEDNPEKLIHTIIPDVLIKGGDYDAQEKNRLNKKYIIGSDFVWEKEGKVLTIPFLEGFSTTHIIDKIKK